MSIEKKSLISTLKTTKKANVAKEDLSVGAATKAVNSPTKVNRFSPTKVNRFSPSKVNKFSPSKVNKFSPSLKTF
jgi:hypothetical protein